MSDPFKDFLDELDRRRRGTDAPAWDPDEVRDTPPPVRPRARRPGSGGGRDRRPRLPLRAFLVPALVALALLGGPVVGMLADAKWFDSLGAASIFWQRLQLQGGLFAGATVATLLFLLAMLAIAGRLADRSDGDAPADGDTSRSRPPLVDAQGRLRFEAFAESLGETFGAGVESMNYKTIRYPGHCGQMRLLMNDLKLNQDRATLKRILENAVPQTLQDVVIV